MAHRAAQQLGLPAAHVERFGGAEPEQVFLAGAQQLSRRRAVVGDGQPTHDGHRHRGQFALDQIGRGGHLVGDRDLGDHQLVAVLVDGARVAVQHRQPRRAHGGVGLAVAPGAAHRVGDHHRDRDAEPVAQSGPQGGGAGVGIDWQQGEFGPPDVGSVHPGGGLDQPEPVLGDQGPPLARQHAHRLVVNQLAAQLVARLGVFGRRNQPALALGHHLAGDDHDVAVAQPGRCGGDGSTEVVAGPEFGKPGHGQDFDRRSGAVLGRGASHQPRPLGPVPR